MEIINLFKTWINSINPSPEQITISQNRIQQCNKCDNLKYLLLFNTYVCGKCNCPINKIIFSENKNKCKLNKWNT